VIALALRHRPRAVVLAGPAITAALCGATASALSGVSLLLAGLMTGYLAARSVPVRLVMRLAAAPPAARGALTRAAGLWNWLAGPRW